MTQRRAAPKTTSIRLQPLPEPTPQSDLLTVKEAAGYLRMSQGWLRAHSTPNGPDPRVPVIRLGKRLVFKRASLDRFIEKYEDTESIAS
jgi:hypothetical protein